jgi:hypothetical protein
MAGSLRLQSRRLRSRSRETEVQLLASSSKHTGCTRAARIVLASVSLTASAIFRHASRSLLSGHFAKRFSSLFPRIVLELFWYPLPVGFTYAAGSDQPRLLTSFSERYIFAGSGGVMNLMTQRHESLRTPGFTAESSISGWSSTYRQQLRKVQAGDAYPAEYNALDCMEDCRRMRMTESFARCACFGMCGRSD